MRKRKRYIHSGRYDPPRGVKLARKMKFEPTLETNSGIKVRSRYEKTCADYLFENKIVFQYEPLLLLGGRQFRPDFYLPEHNLFIEICGYNHMPFYRDRVAEKRRVYERHKLNVIFIRATSQGSFASYLRDELNRRSIPESN